MTGPARGAVILMTMLVILFGMFVPRPRRSRALAALGFGPLAVVMVWKGWTDLDHFKRGNDRHGHAAVDVAVRREADFATALPSRVGAD